MLEGGGEGTIIFNVKKRIGLCVSFKIFIYFFISGQWDCWIWWSQFQFLLTYVITTPVNPQLFIGTHYPPTIFLNGPDAKCPGNGRMSI
jgi:hypothetical protein